MASNYSLKYNVDIVMCIDATGSMNGILSTVKRNALNFYEDLVAQMQKKGKQVNDLRIKVIVFRDYIADGDKAMLASGFFSMPQEREDFRELVNTIKAEGGGDDPEDGLEALGYAMKTKWTQEGDKRRHVIVVWTDAPTHPLGFGRKAKNYPAKMAASFDQLTAWWDQMDSKAKRLLIYAPEEKYWTTVSDCWDNTMHFPSKAGNGLKEFEYSEILSEICNTI